MNNCFLLYFKALKGILDDSNTDLENRQSTEPQQQETQQQSIADQLSPMECNVQHDNIDKPDVAVQDVHTQTRESKCEECIRLSNKNRILHNQLIDARQKLSKKNELIKTLTEGKRWACFIL